MLRKITLVQKKAYFYKLHVTVENSENVDKQGDDTNDLQAVPSSNIFPFMFLHF